MRRIIVKISGESLANYNNTALYDENYMREIFSEIIEIMEMGVQVAIVLGGGNIWRGASSGYLIRRELSDQMGMMASIMNGIFLKGLLEKNGQKAEVFTALEMGNYTRMYDHRSVLDSLENKEIVIFAGGSGHPFFSSDTIVAIRALEIDADDIIYLKNGISAICERDPNHVDVLSNKASARKFSVLSAKRAIEDENIRAIDTAALCMLKDNLKDFHVLGTEKGLIKKFILGEKVGTLVSYDDKESEFMPRDLSEFEEKMNKTVEALEGELSTIRAEEQILKYLPKLHVDYYGTETPLAQVGNVTVPEARIIQIQPWESNMLKAIEKAIQIADLGINPNNDGKVIRLVFPELTEDRRKDLTKEVKKKGEDSKVSVRNIRRDAIDTLKKAEKKSEISEDELRLAEENVQKMTDKYVEKIDETIEKKSKDIFDCLVC